MSVTHVLAVALALVLYRLRRPLDPGKLPLWMRLRPMSGGDVVQGSIFGFITPLGKDTTARARRRRAIARANARRSSDPAHRDRNL